MSKKLILLSVVFVVVSLCVSAALALDPMGPPTTGLKKGQLGAGFSYSYSSMDIDVKGDYFGSHAGSLISLPKKMEMNKYYSILAYGLQKNCEAYLLLGTATNKAEIKSNIVGTKDVDSGNESAIGFGVKMDFYKDEKLKLGGMYQMSWVRDIGVSEVVSVGDGEPWYHTVKGKLNLTEIQIAVGPTYKLNEFASIYGGPFFHFITGDFSYREYCTICGPVNDNTNNVREASWFGGYIGTQVDVGKNTSLNIEYQHTAMADALGMGIIYKF